MKSGSRLGKLRIEAWERHVFLCQGPDCCETQLGEEVWNFLKAELAKTGRSILRSKAACLRICRGGPWLLVYPEGVWYGGVTVERCARIVREHLVEGRVVEEWAELRQPLSGNHPGECRDKTRSGS
jgi:(2Fe-2S) ferredoxin